MLAQGAMPESNHTSKTPFIFFISILHLPHFISMPSTLCKSLTFFPNNFSSSALLSIIFFSPHWQSHIGMGIPQYLCLEIFQSSAFSTQFSNLSPAKAGIQFTFSFSFCITLFIFSTLRKSCLLNLNIKGLLHLQQRG